MMLVSLYIMPLYIVQMSEKHWNNRYLLDKGQALLVIELHLSIKPINIVLFKFDKHWVTGTKVTVRKTAKQNYSSIPLVLY